MLAFGVIRHGEALAKPHATIVRCEDGALRSVGVDVWTEMTECDIDIDNSFELRVDEQLTRFYIPLVVPETGALVGVFETHDREFIHALRASYEHPSAEADEAVVTRLDELLEPPMRGFTSRVGDDEKGIFRHVPGFGPADILLRHGRQPRMGLSLFALGVALVLLVGAAVFGFRPKRSWDADKADFAAWRAQAMAPPAHGNPYV